MERLTRPLFRFDSGWLFIAAGLAVCAAGVLLPAQSDLHALQRQLDVLRAEETKAYARLKAHSDFMDQVDRADPALIRRLTAAQLNLVPEGDTPVLLAGSETSPVTRWIDATVRVDIRPSKPAPNSTLSRLASGPYRLWMFGGGIMCVFVGLLLAPSTVRMRRLAFQRTVTDADSEPSAQAEAVWMDEAPLEQALAADAVGVAQSNRGDVAALPASDDAQIGDYDSVFAAANEKVDVGLPPLATGTDDLTAEHVVSELKEIKVGSVSTQPPAVIHADASEAAANNETATIDSGDSHSSQQDDAAIANLVDEIEGLTETDSRIRRITDDA